MDGHGLIRTIADQNFSLELTPETFLFLVEKESLPHVCGSHGRPWFNPDDCGSKYKPWVNNLRLFCFYWKKKVCPVCVGAMDDHGLIRTITDQNFSLELTPETFLFLEEKESLPLVCGSHGRPWFNPDDCGPKLFKFLMYIRPFLWHYLCHPYFFSCVLFYGIFIDRS